MTWTHIHASFRIDTLNRMNSEYRIYFRDELVDIPDGLHYFIQENPDLQKMAAYVITFWGDLLECNFDIKEFFSGFIKGKDIRQGFLQIEIESEIELYYYVNSENELKKIFEKNSGQ